MTYDLYQNELHRSAQCVRPHAPFFAGGRLPENEVAKENRAHRLIGCSLHLTH